MPEPATAPVLTRAPAGTVVAMPGAPQGLAVDDSGGIIAVGLNGPDGVALVNVTTGRVRMIVRLPGAPRHLQLAGPSGPVLVPAEKVDQLFQIALPSGKVIADTHVGHQPHDAAAIGPVAFVGNEYSNTVSLVRGGKQIAVEPAPLQPGGVTLTATNLLESFRISGQNLVPDRLWPTVRQPDDVAVDEATGRVFVAGTDDHQLQLIDSTTGSAAALAASRSGVAELRAPLLGEGTRALPRVFAGEHRRAQLGLDRERVVLGHALGLPHRGEDRAHGDRAVRGDRVGDLERLGQRLPVRHDMADEPDRGRLGRANVPPGQQQIRRQRVRDLPG